MKLTRREAVVAGGALLTLGVARAAEDEGGVGGVADIVNVAWGTVAPEPREEIEFEDDVYMNELIETDDESAVEIKFSDGSKLTVGENAKVVIDAYGGIDRMVELGVRNATIVLHDNDGVRATMTARCRRRRSSWSTTSTPGST